MNMRPSIEAMAEAAIARAGRRVSPLDAPITIRGVEYPTRRDAAAALGVTYETLCNAVSLGRKEFIGLPAAQTRHRHGGEPMQVRIRGKVYASVKAAAKALRISPHTVRSRLHCGREDFLGLGTSRKHNRSRVGVVSATAKKVRIGPLVFQSIKRAAAELGVKYNTLKNHLDAGDGEWLMAKAMAYEARKLAEAQKAARRGADNKNGEKR